MSKRQQQPTFFATFDKAALTGQAVAAACEANAERQGWDSERAGAFILDWLRVHGPTAGEVLVSEASKGNQPHDARCFGAVFLRLSRKGLIEKCWYTQRTKGHGTSGGIRWALLPDADQPHCTCPDFECGHKCKHLFAVEFRMTKTELHPDGTATVTTVEVRAERKTYAQPNWPAYHAAQVNEYGHFQRLLADLCAMLPETPRKPGRGRKPVTYRDGLFAGVFKVYSLMSARRFSGELAEAQQRGYIDRLPHFNSVLNIFDNADVTPLLKGMVATSALPLAEVETKFAVDSTGFTGSVYHRWFDHKWGQERKSAKWVKAHFTTGVQTNIVTSVDVLEENSSDCRQMRGLINETAEGFTINEVSADKAYVSRRNFETVESHGGSFYPMFRINHTGKSRHAGESFRKALHYFALNRDEYLKHYHLRSNVESTVSMVKRKFSGNLRSRNDTAMRNEALAKFVCHNLCVLIQEMYMLGIDPTFGCTGNDEAAQVLRLPTA